MGDTPEVHPNALRVPVLVELSGVDHAVLDYALEYAEVRWRAQAVDPTQPELVAEFRRQLEAGLIAAQGEHLAEPEPVELVAPEPDALDVLAEQPTVSPEPEPDVPQV